MTEAFDDDDNLNNDDNLDEDDNLDDDDWQQRRNVEVEEDNHDDDVHLVM